MIILIKNEVHKLFKIKVLPFSLLVVILGLIYLMMIYGEFGYDISRLLTTHSDKGLIAYSEKDGRLLTGQEGYEQNKKVASMYSEEINDVFLAQLHADYKSSSYVSFENGERFYNATYSFFQDVFNIGAENYGKRNDVWGKVKGSIQYGFTGDWEALENILHSFFLLFSIFIIIFAAPLFTFDRECGMNAYLNTAKNGGSNLLKYKIVAMFGAINILMFVVLIVISTIHFVQYGFANANVNIQCSYDQRYIGATINCTMGQLTIWTLISGIIGCNMILLLTVLISMINNTTLASFSISLAIIWLPGYPFMQMLENDCILRLLLSVVPVNALYVNALIRDISTWNALWGIFLMRLILFGILFFITTMVWRKKYMQFNG